MRPTSLNGPSLKTNLHTHTTNSDGAHSLEEVVAAYEALDYDVLAITDHNRWIGHRDASTDRLLVLNSNEPSLSHREHLLATGVQEPSPVDAGDRSSTRTQEVIDWINSKGGFSTLNHPAWSGMSVDRLVELKNYHSMEICNAGSTGHGSEYSLTHWDELLRRGRRVWGIATDDSHAEWDRGLGGVEVFCEKEPSAVTRALIDGHFYSSTGPRIDEIVCNGSHLHVRTEPVMGIAVMSEQGPVRVVHGGNETVTELDWDLSKCDDTFLRVEIHRHDGRKAWSNPIFRD